MPIETRSRTTTKPLTPALSSHLRARPTHGLTPRLAGTAPSSPAGHLVRSLRQQTLSPERSEGDKALSLNSNVTPRSGARKSRLDTESPSTPDTASRSKLLDTSVEDDSSRLNYGLGISSPSQTPSQTRPKSTDQLSFLPTANGRRISGRSNASVATEDSKFFRADDVKGTSPSSKPNGSRPKTTYVAQGSSPRVSPKKVESQGDPGLDEKFFYANKVATTSGLGVKSLLATNLSASSAAASSTRSLPIQTQSTASSLRAATGVVKPPQTAPAQTTRPRAPSTIRSTPSPALERRRSSSLNMRSVANEQATGHRKSVSISSTTIPPFNASFSAETPLYSANNTTAPSDLSSLQSTTESTPSDSSLPRSPGLVSTNIVTDSLADSVSKPEKQPPTRPPLQPRHTRGSSEATAIQPVTREQLEAAANARRERKVLDLEISNSSLLAINRTLEKELRKQNTELRRFRRLSRSGRLSFTPANRIVSGASMSTLATLDEAGDDAIHTATSPGSSEGSPDEEDDYFSDDSADDSSSFTESSDMVRRRARDEKRLLQDLQRHHQILVDSQKLTQSIQRCLNCTEELIKDGNKALSYHVEATEVQIGGRVLHHDDEALSEVDFDEYREGMAKPRQGLLSPTVAKDALDEAAMWEAGLQALDRTVAPLNGGKSVFMDKDLTASPSPTLELSPIILPER